MGGRRGGLPLPDNDRNGAFGGGGVFLFLTMTATASAITARPTAASPAISPGQRLPVCSL